MSIERDLRIEIELHGVGAGIMFDRYVANETQLSPERKLYTRAGTNEIYLPSDNIMSFLCAQNTPSAPKILCDSRRYKAIAHNLASFLVVVEDDVTFTRKGKPIVFGGFGADGVDKSSGVRRHLSVARLKNGIPNPKDRPLLPTPWELTFHLDVLANEVLTEDELRRFFVRGGGCVCLGTYRPRFGKFRVARWEPKVFE